MSNYEHKPNRFSLFKNKKKEKDSQPDLTGGGMFVCQHCGEASDSWVSGWTETTKNGEKYISGSIQAKEEVHAKGMAQAKQAAAPSTADDPQVIDDDIPF